MNTRDALLDTLYDDRYRIKRRIGAGGMANVYLADDETLGRQVAIKVLNQRYAEDEQFVERFLREASSAARLNHPNIVQVYDRGESQGTYYIAMEYVDGMTLKELIGRRGALTEDEVLGYGRQAAGGLRFAHRNGVVHRDVKPHNMMVDTEGRLKIADFGIARAGADTGLTEVGSIVGTAQYLAPEQARGETVSAASDLYSLGVVMFEMATGRVPFDGDSPVNVALKHVNDPAPHPTSINPAVSPAVEAIILRAMQKDPSQRHQTADELLADIDSARHGTVSSATAAITSVIASPLATQGTETAMQGGLQPPPRRPDYGAAYAAAEDDYTNGRYDDTDGDGDGDGDDGRDGPRRSKRRVWPYLLLLLLLAGVAGAAWLLTSGEAKPVMVSVPDVVGLKRAEAENLLHDKNLDVTVGEAFDAEAPTGEVIDQDPDGGGQIEEGSDIEITVSKGVEPVAMPQVVGLTQQQAEQALNNAGLEPDPRDVFSNRPEGEVVAQAVIAGEMVDPGTKVRINVSKGAKLVEVPAVVGLTKAEARKAVEDAGFDVDFEAPEDGPTPKNEVLDQQPNAGTQAKIGSTVTLTVASGFNTVPDIVDDAAPLIYADAVALVQDAGFVASCTIVDDATILPGDPPRVTGQNPAAGARLELGGSVTVEVSKAPGDPSPCP